ncbi:MAG: hypothetical protein Q9161_006358 [Pseudevernia consocians]
MATAAGEVPSSALQSLYYVIKLRGPQALAFGYFEILLRLGDASKMLEEAARFRAFEVLMHAVGIADLYEDLIEPTADLLEQQAATLPNHDGGAAILAIFNDDAPSSQLTYSFKLITSAWMKSNAESYAGFLPDMDVHTYCARNIEPFSIELDHVGLQALATAIINEAGMAIEVLYLDRSAGEEVTPHRLPVLDADGNEKKGGPTIRLLYRPRGHYDLLYKTEDVAEMSRHTLSNPQIRLVSNPQITLSNNPQFSHTGNLEILTAIPGFSSGPFQLPFTPTSTEPYQSKVETFSTPRTMTPAPQIYPPYQSKVEPFTSTTRTATPATPIYPSMDPAVKEEHSPKAATTSPISPTPKTLPIQVDFKPRTKQQRKYDKRFKGQGEQVPSDVLKECSPDRSKKEDPAHFTNQAFQPQIWQPGRDYDKAGEPETSRRKSS